MDQRTIAVVGLGLMGTAMAERLLAAGYTVVVHNRTRSKADPLLARGAHWSDDPLADCPRVVISLYTTDTVREVLSGWWSRLRAGQILIDTTTGDPQQTSQLGARLADRGVQYLDAPISGSSEQTRRGEATALVGGSAEAFRHCQDLWDCLTRHAFYAGPCGSGAKMKLVANLVLGLNRAALAEGLVFASAIGLDPAAAFEVLRGTVAYSRTMDTKGHKMLDRDFAPQARLAQHLKDVRLILETAGETGQPLPLSATHRQLLERAVTLGYGDADNSAVIQALVTDGEQNDSSEPC